MVGGVCTKVCWCVCLEIAQKEEAAAGRGRNLSADKIVFLHACVRVSVYLSVLPSFRPPVCLSAYDLVLSLYWKCVFVSVVECFLPCSQACFSIPGEHDDVLCHAHKTSPPHPAPPNTRHVCRNVCPCECMCVCVLQLWPNGPLMNATPHSR